jgi:hypothetical protein
MTRDPQTVEADERLWRVVSASAIVGRLRAASDAVQRARPESAAVGMMRRVMSTWQHWSPGERSQFVGTACVIASAVHVLLLTPSHPPGGWWLILPASAAIYGAAVLGLGLAAPPKE